MLEENFRRAMLLSRGSFGASFTRPISGTLLSLIGIFAARQVPSRNSPRSDGMQFMI